MKSKLIISTIFMILLIATGIAAIVLYFYTGNIASKIPEHIINQCNISEEKYQGRSVFILTPKQETNTQQTIFYLHGGSYVAELSNAHWKFLSKLTQDTNSTIIVPDYPLTPQYNYIHTFAMIEPLYKEIAKKVDNSHFILMGDSAGGGMALALLEKMVQQEVQKPTKTILISPWLDVSMENPAIKTVQEKDKLLNSELLKVAGICYAGTEERIKNYLVSPIYGPLENLENVIIYTGTNDILNPDVHVLALKAKKSGSNMIIKETKEAVHDWLIQRYQDENYEDDLAKEAYKQLIQDITQEQAETENLNK